MSENQKSNHTRLKVIFSFAYEKTRVIDTLKKLDWFKVNGYSKSLILPKAVTEKSTPEHIQKHLESEWDESLYISKKNEAEDYFKTHEAEIKQAFLSTFNHSFKEIKLYLTRYGVGGSYNPPNTIIINISNSDITKTLIHEMIHLMIEKDIQKYKIEHWEKERIVDLTINSSAFSFVKGQKWQTSYQSSEKYIDPLYEELFLTNREEFYTQLKDNRPIK